MPVTVTHLLDRHTPEDARRLLALLLRLAPAQRIQQRVVVLGPPASDLQSPSGVPVMRVPLRCDWPMLSLPALRRLFRTNPTDVLHALDARAAGVAAGLNRAGLSVPVVATLCDPAQAQTASRWWRVLHAAGPDVELLCSSSIVQRRLVEAGVPPTATAVVRPGVDFSEIRRARESSHPVLRIQSSTSTPRGPVLLMPSPPSRAAGQFLGVWAVAILHQIWPGVRLLIPGRSREADRIARLVREIYCPQAFVLTGDSHSPAELLAASDAMLVPAVEDVPTAWLAWAMAAGVPIIGSAIPSVTEFIADRHNGFLCKPGEPHTLAIRVRTVFESPDQMRQCADVSRGQAYDVFRAQQCIEQYVSAFTNLAAGRPAVTAVQDAAVVT